MRHFRFLYIIYVALFATACADEVGLSEKWYPWQSPQSSSFLISQDSLIFYSEGGSRTINIISDFEWSVKAKPDYVVISPMSGGIGSTDIIITVQRNAETLEREGKIEISITTLPNGKALSRTIAIVQDLRGEDGRGHTWVDLGLPSGTLWATCNVGADSPEDYGDYFAWGETKPESIYDWSTYKYCNGSLNTMTKYCQSSSYGTIDNKTELDFEDDAAYMNWGKGWGMPSLAQQIELCDTDNCTWTWTNINGNNGYLVKSKRNESSLFLPAAGRRYRNTLYNADTCGYYWSRSLRTTSSYYAYNLSFQLGYIGWIGDYRYYGRTVRPVRVPTSE